MGKKMWSLAITTNRLFCFEVNVFAFMTTPLCVCFHTSIKQQEGLLYESFMITLEKQTNFMKR